MVRRALHNDKNRFLHYAHRCEHDDHGEEEGANRVGDFPFGLDHDNYRSDEHADTLNQITFSGRERERRKRIKVRKIVFEIEGDWWKKELS